MAIHTGGTLSRRTVLAVMAGVVVSAGGLSRSKPSAAQDAQFATALHQPVAQGRTGLTGTPRYAHDSTQWGHLLVTDLQTGQRTPVATDYGRLAAFGSSTIALSGPRFATEFPGIPFHKGGRGGELAEQTLARLGSRPVRVDAGTIPASGPVVLRAGNMAGAVRSMASFTGTLAGVQGTLSASRGRRGTVTFTRTRPGAPATIREGAVFLPGHGQRGCILLLNLGKNNLNGSDGTQDVNTLLRWTRDAVAWNGEDNALVMGHFVNTGTPRAGSALRDRVTAYNQAARAEFGARFFDLGGFITSPNVWDYAEVTPTAADRRQQATGNKPPSLSRDHAHLNSAGNDAVARHLHEHLTGLGWLRSRTGRSGNP